MLDSLLVQRFLDRIVPSFVNPQKSYKTVDSAGRNGADIQVLGNLNMVADVATVFHLQIQLLALFLDGALLGGESHATG